MLEALEQVGGAVDDCAEAALWGLSDDELLASLDATQVLAQRLATVQLGLVRELDGRGLAVAQGASSTAVWLRERLRLSGRNARHLVQLAATIDAAPPAVRDALLSGAITVEQGRVVAETIAALPVEAGPEVADKATQLLVTWADRFDPTSLSRLGERVLTHVAPDLADQAELKALERATERAEARRHVTLSEQENGQVRLSGNLDTETASLLREAIDPLCAPAGEHDDRSPGQRRADALGEICRLALRTGQLPDNGGDRPQVVVTVSMGDLVNGVRAGTLETGTRLTPGAVRRLACDAGVLPVVLGGNSQVLDVGRQRRLFTGPLRRALVLRDGGCAFPGCDRPPRWCDGHHIRHWADGGTTALDNAVLLCGYHHRFIHRGDWTVRIAADGRPDFLPPSWLDPLRTPRRNLYHRRC
ncbi:HNH endonuclease signature motif containing protein [Micromonospora foliorum]|uniref:HNH endonuclease signature motif containing protein n=1 Tax=Micromonospora foliorum TaxID=2911210 RepID=UPI001EE9A9EB|nr:HNH endonuclease signature motif containing protein [Micromonospora foliorum]MCG5439263.1 HNH endonuclease [Micromonospora foliorum]